MFRFIRLKNFYFWLVFILTTSSYSQDNQYGEVKLNLQKPNIVELIIPSNDNKITVEVLKINENKKDEVGEIIYVKTTRCNKHTNSWWVSKPGNYVLLVSKKINNKRVILQKETFKID